jgi:hypothetical protein
MFLVSTFCEIAKNSSYILNIVKTKSHKFSRYQEWSIPIIGGGGASKQLCGESSI